MDQAETDIEFLKSLGAPSGDGVDGEGLLNSLNDRINKLRTEFIAIVKDHDFNLNAKIDSN